MLCPLDEVVRLWQEIRELEESDPTRPHEDPELWEECGDYDDRVRALVTHPGRVTIASRLSEVELQLDFVPHDGGQSGQVIYPVTECDWIALASSFEALLGRWVDLLTAGRLRLDPDSGLFTAIDPDVGVEDLLTGPQ